jgi:hypothetical protein
VRIEGVGGIFKERKKKSKLYEKQSILRRVME